MKYEMQHRTLGGTMCLADSPLKTLCLFAAVLVEDRETGTVDRGAWRLMEVPKNKPSRPVKLKREFHGVCVAITQGCLGMLDTAVSFYEVTK